MTIEEQVCTLNQAKRLKGLGVSQDAFLSWFGDESHTVVDYGNEKLNIPMSVSTHVLIMTTLPVNNMDDEHRSDCSYTVPIASAFTVAELGEMLPAGCQSCYNDHHGHWVSEFIEAYSDLDEPYIAPYPSEGFKRTAYVDDEDNLTEAQARADLLIHLLESNLITAQEVNERL